MPAISRILASLWLKKNKSSPQETLSWLLKMASSTRFGERYGFSNILKAPDPYTAFAEVVPIMDYSGWLKFLGPKYQFQKDKPTILEDEAWPGKIVNFCLSSGTTTGKTKYIPYSPQMAAQNRRAAVDLIAHLILLEPAFNPITHKTLYMSGSTSLAPDKEGVVAGDMSGLTKYLAPKALSWMTLPPQSISSIEPWNRRLPALVDYAIEQGPKIGILSGIPVWQKAFLDAVHGSTGRPIKEIFPNLRFLIHGGMPLGPYEAPLRTLLGTSVRFIDVYAASETGITAVGLSTTPGLNLWPNYGVFYEFEDSHQKVVPFWEVVEGRHYQMIVSSCAGLWRYRIGDTVRVRQKDPLKVDSVFRAQTTTAFDEKVTEEQVVLALKQAFPDVSDFSMGPDLKNKRHHWFLIAPSDTAKANSQKLDIELRKLNQDYDDYRSDGRIQPPVLSQIKNRAHFLESIGREEGGQRKFPRLLSADEVDILQQDLL